MRYVNKDYVSIHQTYRIALTWHYFVEFIKKICHVEIHSWCCAWLCQFTPTWCWPRVFARLQRVLVYFVANIPRVCSWRTCQCFGKGKTPGHQTDHLYLGGWLGGLSLQNISSAGNWSRMNSSPGSHRDFIGRIWRPSDCFSKALDLSALVSVTA